MTPEEKSEGLKLGDFAGLNILSKKLKNKDMPGLVEETSIFLNNFAMFLAIIVVMMVFTFLNRFHLIN